MTGSGPGDAGHPSATLYLLGALDGPEEAEFERHLASCPTCRRDCDDLGPLVSGLSLLPDDEVAALLGAAPDVATDEPPDAPASGRRELADEPDPGRDDQPPRCA
ncbi:anti-sigma factor family protein [Micromonospora sp. NPDC093277]|uniref:anti-sigma factor family protein n=1 Tax=Micromonospora sp. NPDC093277 TaxID=3364291 RepID=UPI00382D5CA7